MKRRFGTLFCFSILCSIVITGCGNKTVDTVTEEQKVIKFVNSKSEVKEHIEFLAAEYEKETGVKVEVITTNAGVNVQATLKGLYLADKMPDIIVCESSDFSHWDGLLVDLSNEEWVKRTEAAYKDNSQVIGFPFTTEAIGLIYNKNILDKAGIDPSSITTTTDMEQALKTLDEKKDSLGIIAAVGYCAEPENVGWSSGNHIFGNYIDSGLSRDDTTYIDKLNNEKAIDETRFKKFADFIGLLQTYADPALISGTYDDQVNNFAAGKYAFVTQGSWIGASMTGAASDLYAKAGNFEVGMLPYIFEDGIDTILTNSPSWWAVVKEGDTEASKAFLQWCSTESGQKILVEKAGFVSPFADCKFVATDPFAPVLSSYVSIGKTSSWHWLSMPTGLGQNYLSYAFYHYATGEVDADGFMHEISTIIENTVK